MFPDSPALLFFGGLFPGLPVLFGRRWFRFPKNGPYPVPIGRIGHQDEFFPEQILVLFHQVIPLVHVFYIVHPLEIIQAVPQIHGDVVGLGDFFCSFSLLEVSMSTMRQCPPCIFMLCFAYYTPFDRILPLDFKTTQVVRRLDLGWMDHIGRLNLSAVSGSQPKV